MRLIVVALLVGCATSALSATYYVDPSPGCADSNTGTSATARWCTPPGTRNTNDTAFLRNAWGNITTNNKIQCGDSILLKGGSTHDSSDGGAWRLDGNLYIRSCPLSSRITIRIATAAEWSGGAGHFTLDGTGIMPTCTTFCGPGGIGGLIYVGDALNNLTLGGVGASARLIVRDTGDGPGLDGGIAAYAGFNQEIQGLLLEWIEATSSAEIGILMGRVSDSLVRQVSTHDNNGAGIDLGSFAQTAYIRRVGVEDFTSTRDGLRPQLQIGESIRAPAYDDLWIVRARVSQAGSRAVEMGGDTAQLVTGQDVIFRLRDSAIYNNGSPGAYSTPIGICGSGDDNFSQPPGCMGQQNGYVCPGPPFNRSILQRVKVVSNGYGGGPCAYGKAWGEVWNSVFYDNGDLAGTTAGQPGDIIIGDTDGFGIFNTITTRQGGAPPLRAIQGTFNASGLGSLQPKTAYNLFRPALSNTEGFCHNHTGGSNFTQTANNYATKCAYNDPTDKIGVAFDPKFVALDPQVYANNNFQLQPGSDAIDAGTCMFRATNAGNGSTITVSSFGCIRGVANCDGNPAHYFIGPNSYYSATPDRIQIDGCGVVTVTGFPANNKISFSPSCGSWQNNACVHFPWSGTAPDMGVFEFDTNTLAPPRLLSVTPES